MSKMCPPTLDARLIQLAVEWYQMEMQVKKPVWAKRGNRYSHPYHYMPSMFTNQGSIQRITRCGVELPLESMIFCVTPVGRRDRKCEKCVLIEAMDDLRE